MIIKPKYDYTKKVNVSDKISAFRLNQLSKTSTTADRLNLSFDEEV